MLLLTRYAGQNVEMYIHRSGYHPPHEALATHCRRRYRLTPAQNGNQNTAPCDPSLWIIHYARADQQNQFPANRIPVNPQVQTMMSQRRYLQQHGQLVRKEFMLHDRNNWPTVNLPQGQMPQYPQQVSGYPGNVISHMGRSQQPSYIQEQQAASQQGGMGPSPAKRPRPTPPSQRPGSSTSIAAAAMAHDATVDDEEDTSRGDLMDFLTPRDISTMRYTQHHEWMEEIFSSPYATGQIIPVDLGLGRKGELESLTRGFFEAPTGGTPRTDGQVEPLRAGKMDQGKAEEFTLHASEKITQINVEMENMRRRHARRMAKLEKSGFVYDAEKRLRNMITNSSETGTDIWRIDTQTQKRDAVIAALSQQEKVDEIAREAEAALGRMIEIVKDVHCIQKGGLEEKTPPEVSEFDDAITNDAEVVSTSQMTRPPIEHNSSQGVLPASGERVNRPPKQPSAANSLNTHDIDPPTSQGLTPFDENIDLGPDDAHGSAADHTMEEPSRNGQPGNKEVDSGDWVMVDKESDPGAPRREEPGKVDIFDSDIREQQGQSAPGDGLPDFTADVEGTTGPGFDSNEFGDDIDFGNLDSAGDALAGYGEEDVVVGADENADLGLEDSAFGEAFHDTEPHSEREGEMSGI